MRFLSLVLALAALSIASTSMAEAPRYAGVIAGLNVSDLDIKGRDNIDVRTSFAWGGVFDWGVTDKFGIRIEPSFVSKGGKATKRNAYWGNVDSAIFKLGYFEVPILARYDLGGPGAHGYLLGGLAVGFQRDAKLELSIANNGETVDFGEVFNPLDASLHLGAGLSYPIAENRLNFDGRVAIGLTDINQGGTVTFLGAPLVVPSTTTHTLDFRFLASYLFALPK
jgi:hypothetical protein